MKKSINLFLPVFAALIMFASCGSNKSAMHRNYNKRYYIGMSKSERTNEVVSGEQNISAEESTFVAAENGFISTKNETSYQNSSDSAHVSLSKSESYSDTGKEPLNIRKAPTKIKDEYPFALLKKTSEIKEKIVPASSEDDALSLLWIIILILVILWLIGLISGGFGIGGAIHLLALIALILLILWLLRII